MPMASALFSFLEIPQPLLRAALGCATNGCTFIESIRGRPGGMPSRAAYQPVSRPFYRMTDPTNPMSGDAFTEDIPQVSEKNTKAELASAYKTLVKKYEEKVRGKSAADIRRTADVAAIEKVSGHTVAAILDQMEALKRSMGQTINELSQALLAEEKRLEDIRAAAVAEERRLKDLRDIDAGAVALEDLIRAQEARKESFEEEYEKMRHARRRDEEEYQLTQAQQRKKEAITREEQEAAFRKREEELRAREEEFRELRARVEAFPAEQERAIVHARSETQTQVEKEMRMQAELIAKETEGERKVSGARITFLESTAAKQTEEITTLKKELDAAFRQVQSIAEKAIEGSSGRQTLQAVSDIALQRAGRTRSSEE